MFEKKETVCLRVPGMHCAHCVARVQKILEALDGVRRASVSLEKATAQVVYIPSKVSVDAMRQALSEGGFSEVV